MVKIIRLVGGFDALLLEIRDQVSMIAMLETRLSLKFVRKRLRIVFLNVHYYTKVDTEVSMLSM